MVIRLLGADVAHCDCCIVSFFMVLMLFDAEGAAGTNLLMVFEVQLLLRALIALMALLQFEVLVVLRVVHDAGGVGCHGSCLC